MRDPYITDEKVGELAVKVEETRLSPERPGVFHEALLMASQETGVSVAGIANRLAKVLYKSERIKPARKEYLSHWLAENFVYYTQRR